MLSLDSNGRITEANHRCVELFRVLNDKRLIGLDVLDFICPEDRGMFRQALERLDLDNIAGCEIGMVVENASIDVHVECAAVRDEDGAILSVRLSMFDVGPVNALQRELADQGGLLNLIFNHMSDAILLVDADGRIAAHNQQLSILLQRRPESLSGSRYDLDRFWNRLGVLDRDHFFYSLRQIEADWQRPAQQRVDTRVGTFLFQGIPVNDESARPVGRLWVVQEITSQEQSKRLIDQQAMQLCAIKRVGTALSGVKSIEQLLTQAAQLLFDQFNVEAVGLALREGTANARAMQVLHRGLTDYLIAPNRALIEGVHRHLMPRIIGHEDVTFWTELPASLPWSKAFGRAGITCVAAAPLQCSADAQGIIWIGRRGGESLER